VPSSVRFVIRGAGIREVLKSEGVAADMHRRAEQVAAAMRANAPVESGALQASIVVTDEMQPTRAVSHVGATVHYAPIIEAATGFMNRSLDAAR
jgi:hypothetical protein